MSARRRRMREPARTSGERRLQACRSGLLVQGFDYPPEAAEGAAKAKTADHAGAIASGLPPGAGRSGRQAIAADFIRPENALMSGIAAPPCNFREDHHAHQCTQ